MVFDVVQVKIYLYGCCFCDVILKQNKVLSETDNRTKNEIDENNTDE